MINLDNIIRSKRNKKINMKYTENRLFSSLVSKISSINMSIICFIIYKSVRNFELSDEVTKSVAGIEKRTQ